MKIKDLEKYKDENNIIDLNLLDNDDFETREFLEGIHPKKWYLFEDGKILFKQSDNEFGYFGELLYAKLAQNCGVNHAEYFLAKKDNKIGVMTPDFIKNDIYISGREIIAKGLNYSHIKYNDFNIIEEYNKHNNLRDVKKYLKEMFVNEEIVSFIIKDMVKMFTLDVLTCNNDRHTTNWGILIGDDIKLSPVFDNESMANLDTEYEQFKRSIENILKSNGKKTIDDFLGDNGFSYLGELNQTPRCEQLITLYTKSNKDLKDEIETIVNAFNVKKTVNEIEKTHNIKLPFEVKLFIESAMEIKQEFLSKEIFQIKEKERILNGGFRKPIV